MSDEQVEPTAAPIDGIDGDLLARAREAAAGHPGLEDALRRLDALDDVDLDQHPAEFDAIHRALRAALADARAGAGTGRPMTRRVRLDAELVRRDLARSREHASTLIDAGHVLVGGRVAAKPATQVGTDQAIVVRSTDEPTWASRGAHKLLGALAVFEPLGLVVEGRRCLDAGASTGGFTDVLLRRGAAEVCAVDVGYGQLVWSLQSDERVHVHDRTNVRTLQPDDIGGPVELVVADLSFISLTVVMPALTRACVQEGDIVLMIKPQFEVGKQQPRQERRRARSRAACRRGAPGLPVRARARLGHPRARAQPAARPGRQRRVLLLAPHRRGRAVRGRRARRRRRRPVGAS